MIIVCTFVGVFVFAFQFSTTKARLVASSLGPWHNVCPLQLNRPYQSHTHTHTAYAMSQCLLMCVVNKARLIPSDRCVPQEVNCFIVSL